MGALNEHGYGVVGNPGGGNGNSKVHRVVYEHFVEPIPKGMFLCHRCDVPACCNPHHMFVGTAMDNQRDSLKKGRHAKPPRNTHIKGVVHYGARLDDEKIRAIRSAANEGATHQGLADTYGVCRQNITNIVAKKTWKHVS